MILGFLILIGSVALLMYGMKVMSEGLQKMAGSKLRNVLATATTNRFTGLLTGAFITTSIQSSTATTVMTVSFVSAGLLTLSQAISVIMGANIGTTATAWIMVLGGSFDMRLMVYAAIVLAVGLIYSHKNTNMGEFIMGLALMLLGLTTLKTNALDMHLDQIPAIKHIFDSTSHLGPGDCGTYFLYLLIGGLLTCAVQSSAAIMAITMTLCSTGVLDIYAGIALVMGENIGTTITSNVVALSASTEAQKAARAHLIFNMFGVVWVLCIYKYFVNFVCSLVGCDPQNVGDPIILNAVLAAFHTSFNVCNVLILIWFIKPLEKVVCLLVPSESKKSRDEERGLKFISGGILSTAELSILEARKEIALFGERCEKQYNYVLQMHEIEKDDEFDKIYQKVEKYETITDNMEFEIAHYLQQVAEGRLSDDAKRQIQRMLREIDDLESIGDCNFNIARTLSRKRMLCKEHFTEEQLSNIRKMEKLVGESVQLMCETLNAGEGEGHNIQQSYRLENDVNTLRTFLRDENLQKVSQGDYDYQLGSFYIDVINGLEKLADYVLNVVQCKARQTRV